MDDDRPGEALRHIISQRINSLVLEMQEADWSAEQVIACVSDVIASEWEPKFRALEDARQASPTNFVSDGNEG